METPEDLKLECYETTIYDFNKINFREAGTKTFKSKLQKIDVERLPYHVSVVVTMRVKDVTSLFDINNIMLN